MPDISFNVKGPNAVVDAYAQMQKAQAAAAAGAGQLNEKLKLTSKEAKALDRLQAEIARRHETGTQKYVRQLDETKRALAGNKNEAELLRKETTRLTVEFNRANDAGRRTAAEHAAALSRATAKARDYSGVIATAGKSAAGARAALVGIGTASDGAFGQGALDRLSQYAAGFFTVQTAVAALNEEMRLHQELVDKAAAAQLTVSQGRNVLLRSMVGSSDADIKRAMGASRLISRETGVSEAKIAPALADAISAIGGDVEKAVEATRVAATYMADSPDDIREFAGSLLDISKVTKTTDATANLGLYQMLGQLSRVNAPKLMQNSIPRSLVGQGSFGSTYRESGALFAALSNAGGDEEGRRTSTATVQLARQLDRFTRKATGRDLTFSEQLELMWTRPELAQKFLTPKEEGGFGASFESATLGPVRDLLLDAQSRAANEYRKALARIPGLAGLRAEGSLGQAMFDKYNPLNVVARRDRALTSGLEQLQIDMAATGSLSMAQRETVKSMLMEAGVGGINAKTLDFVNGLTDGGRALTAESAIKMLQYAEKVNEGLIGQTAAGRVGRRGPMSEEAQRRDRVLEEVIRILQALETDRQKAVEAADQQGNLLSRIERNTRAGGLVGVDV